MQKCRKFLENVLKSRKQRLVALRKGKIFKLLRYFVHFIIIFHFLFVFCHFLAISHFVPCDMGPRIVNMSLSTWVFPDTLKHAIISPIIKKPSLDQSSLKNYTAQFLTSSSSPKSSRSVLLIISLNTWSKINWASHYNQLTVWRTVQKLLCWR